MTSKQSAKSNGYDVFEVEFWLLLIDTCEWK